MTHQTRSEATQPNVRLHGFPNLYSKQNGDAHSVMASPRDCLAKLHNRTAPYKHASTHKAAFATISHYTLIRHGVLTTPRLDKYFDHLPYRLSYSFTHWSFRYRSSSH